MSLCLSKKKKKINTGTPLSGSSQKQTGFRPLSDYKPHTKKSNTINLPKNNLISQFKQAKKAKELEKKMEEKKRKGWKVLQSNRKNSNGTNNIRDTFEEVPDEDELEEEYDPVKEIYDRQREKQRQQEEKRRSRHNSEQNMAMQNLNYQASVALDNSIRMRNFGSKTKTSSGPNSYYKDDQRGFVSQGFLEKKKNVELQNQISNLEHNYYQAKKRVQSHNTNNNKPHSEFDITQFTQNNNRVRESPTSDYTTDFSQRSRCSSHSSNYSHHQQNQKPPGPASVDYGHSSQSSHYKSSRSTTPYAQIKSTIQNTSNFHGRQVPIVLSDDDDDNGDAKLDLYENPYKRRGGNNRKV